MIRTITILAIILLTAWGAPGQRTTVRPLRSATEAPVAPADTIRGAEADSLLIFSGYEKTLRASKETIFVTNRSDRGVCTVIFTVTYLDAQGRQLHRRTVRQHVDLPAGETRRLDFPAWDTQRTTYFSGGPRPRVAAIPYTVAVTEPKAIAEPCSNTP